MMNKPPTIVKTVEENNLFRIFSELWMQLYTHQIHEEIQLSGKVKYEKDGRKWVVGITRKHHIRKTVKKTKGKPSDGSETTHFKGRTE